MHNSRAGYASPCLFLISSHLSTATWQWSFEDLDMSHRSDRSLERLRPRLIWTCLAALERKRERERGREGGRERGREGERERGRDNNKDRDKAGTVWLALRELQSDVVCSWLRNMHAFLLSASFRTICQSHIHIQGSQFWLPALLKAEEKKQWVTCYRLHCVGFCLHGASFSEEIAQHCIKTSGISPIGDFPCSAHVLWVSVWGCKDPISCGVRPKARWQFQIRKTKEDEPETPHLSDRTVADMLFSLINHPLWGTPIYGNPHVTVHVGKVGKVKAARRWEDGRVGGQSQWLSVVTKISLHCL